jgi:hypothetical protein
MIPDQLAEEKACHWVIVSLGDLDIESCFS